MSLGPKDKRQGQRCGLTGLGVTVPDGDGARSWEIWFLNFRQPLTGFDLDMTTLKTPVPHS